MPKLHKFSFCRVHTNCLGFLCDTHLLKQEKQHTISNVKSREHVHLPGYRICSSHVLHFFRFVDQSVEQQKIKRPLPLWRHAYAVVLKIARARVKTACAKDKHFTHYAICNNFKKCKFDLNAIYWATYKDTFDSVSNIAFFLLVLKEYNSIQFGNLFWWR